MTNTDRSFTHQNNTQSVSIKSPASHIRLIGVLLVSGFIFQNSVNATTINFDDLPAMGSLGGPVPSFAKLSNQLQATTGASFSTMGGAPFVGVTSFWGGTTSAPNGIGGVTPIHQWLSYGYPISVTFSVPGSPLTPATTDFVSISGSEQYSSTGIIYLDAYDSLGVKIASTSKFNTTSTVLSLSAPGISSVTFYSSNGGVSFDDLKFTAISAVPEPSTFLLTLFGVAVLFVRRLGIYRFTGAASDA
jgi:hypothetical protein